MVNGMSDGKARRHDSVEESNPPIEYVLKDWVGVLFLPETVVGMALFVA